MAWTDEKNPHTRSNNWHGWMRKTTRTVEQRDMNERKTTRKVKNKHERNPNKTRNEQTGMDGRKKIIKTK